MAEMNFYEKVLLRKLHDWEKEITAKRPLRGKYLALQKKLDSLLPDVIHEKLTKALEMSVKSLLGGLSLISCSSLELHRRRNTPLEVLDVEAMKTVEKYKKIAMVEGAGTGAGGFLLSTVDFPALLAVKFKMLQELAVIYGYSVKEVEERWFLIKIFQLAYSGENGKKATFEELKGWQQKPSLLPRSLEQTMAWRSFYEEYRASIEFRKFLQFIPGLGALVGLWANRSITDELGTTAINVFRMRRLQEKYGDQIF